MTESQEPAEKKFLSARWITLIVLLAVALLFIFSNRDTATMHFMWMRFIAPGWLWFLLLLAIGVVIGSIFPWFQKKKKR